MLKEHVPPHNARSVEELDARHDPEEEGLCEDTVFSQVSRQPIWNAGASVSESISEIARLVCTRPEMHAGDHVASDLTGKVYGQWPADELSDEDECPDCRRGTLKELEEADMLCCDECGNFFKLNRETRPVHGRVLVNKF